MLDLRTYQKKYELTWFDGTVYHFPLPTQELLMKVLKLEDIEDTSEQFKCIKTIIKDILNSNEEGKKFTKEELDLPMNIIQVILEDYMNSVNQQLGE